jgi:hypothetical protein
MALHQGSLRSCRAHRRVRGTHRGVRTVVDDDTGNGDGLRERRGGKEQREQGETGWLAHWLDVTALSAAVHERSAGQRPLKTISPKRFMPAPPSEPAS